MLTIDNDLGLEVDEMIQIRPTSPSEKILANKNYSLARIETISGGATSNCSFIHISIIGDVEGERCYLRYYDGVWVLYTDGDKPRDVEIEKL